MDSVTDELKVIGCKRVRDGPPAVESAMTACSVCGCAVWVSLSSVPGIKRESLQIVCMHCLPALIEGEEMRFEVLPEQVDEIGEVLRRQN